MAKLFSLNQVKASVAASLAKSATQPLCPNLLLTIFNDLDSLAWTAPVYNMVPCNSHPVAAGGDDSRVVTDGGVPSASFVGRGEEPPRRAFHNICRRYRRSGHCKYGSQCYYKHIRQVGVDAEEAADNDSTNSEDATEHEITVQRHPIVCKRELLDVVFVAWRLQASIQSPVRTVRPAIEAVEIHTPTSVATEAEEATVTNGSNAAFFDFSTNIHDVQDFADVASEDVRWAASVELPAIPPIPKLFCEPNPDCSDSESFLNKEIQTVADDTHLDNTSSSQLYCKTKLSHLWGQQCQCSACLQKTLIKSLAIDETEDLALNVSRTSRECNLTETNEEIVRSFLSNGGFRIDDQYFESMLSEFIRLDSTRWASLKCEFASFGWLTHDEFGTFCKHFPVCRKGNKCTFKHLNVELLARIESDARDRSC